MNPNSSHRTRPQKLKERLKEVAAEAILDAAEDVFLRHGLDAPMEVVASHAGVAVGTLYNHFTDRRALVASLVDRHRAAMRVEVSEACTATATQPVRAQLHAMLRAMIGHWSRFYLLIRHSELFPDMKKRKDIRERFLSLFGPVIERGMREKAITKGDLDLHAIHLQSLVHSFFSFCADEPKRLTTDQAVDHVVDNFLRAVHPGTRP